MLIASIQRGNCLDEETREETTMNSSCTESTEAASNAGMSEAAELSGTVSPRKAERARRRLVSS